MSKVNTEKGDALLNQMNKLRRELKSVALDVMQEMAAIRKDNQDPLLMISIDKRASEAEHIFNSLEW